MVNLHSREKERVCLFVLRMYKIKRQKTKGAVTVHILNQKKEKVRQKTL